ncbi:MAG: beta-galactosidase trimerization domain-containing protein [Anaerolineae bacterium]
MSYWWENQPWRMIQTNLREIDMADIDAGRYAADLRSFQATAALINAAGIIASYPTRLPYHFQSPYLTGDSLQDIIAACHKVGIRVLARCDLSKIRRPIYEQHPDWAYRTPEGGIVDYNGDIHACINGDYQQVYALKIVEELLTTHDFDGIFFNMGGYQTTDYSHVYYGVCHCARCRDGFRARFGLDLPAKEDRADPVYRKYMVFKRETSAGAMHAMWAHIHALRPEICCNHETELLTGYLRQESNTEPDRLLPHWQYSGSSNTKSAVSAYPELISSNTTVDFIGIWYRHVAVSPFEQELRLAQNLANGGALDYYLIGRLDNHHDKSGYAGIRRIFHYHAAHGTEYLGNTSQADVALLEDSGGGAAETRGWFRVLAENHFLFDLPQTATFARQDWSRYKVIILPNLRYVSAELAARLDDWVAAGGTLVASGEVSFYDADYEARALPALKALGIAAVEDQRELDRSAYFLMDAKPEFTRFAETDLLYIRSPYWYCRFAGGVQARFKLIPPHNFGPPERCYWDTVTDRPAFTVNAYGRGKAIYLPWLPGQLFYRQGHTNTGDFLADLLEHVAGAMPVGGNLSPMVEVTLFRQPGGSLLAHLVNGSGHFGTTYYPPVEMRGVTAVLPCAEQPAAVRSLVSGQPVPFGWADGRLTLEIESLGLFEAIKICC